MKISFKLHYPLQLDDTRTGERSKHIASEEYEQSPNKATSKDSKEVGKAKLFFKENCTYD